MAETLKRVVLLRRSGLHIIVGTFDPSVHTLRDFVEFDVRGYSGTQERTSASLLQVQPRFVLYREIMEPPKSGKLGEFHPSQR